MTEFSTAEKRQEAGFTCTTHERSGSFHTGSYRLRNATLFWVSLEGGGARIRAALSRRFGRARGRDGHDAIFFRTPPPQLAIEVARSHLDSLERSLTNGVCILN